VPLVLFCSPIAEVKPPIPELGLKVRKTHRISLLLAEAKKQAILVKNSR
jgi:hypothetical protein